MMFYVLRVISYPLREEKGSPMAEQANEATQRSRPYAFFVAALAIVVAFLAFLSSILLFGDLFNNATTVIAALGSLFTLIGTIVGAYFGIKVSNDTSERTHGAIEKAHGSAMEANEKTQQANERAQKANDTAKKALAELDPNVARRIVNG
jgi:predicted lipid-binding transport protein (Tim44 family)